jgi:hypothetical protein
MRKTDNEDKDRELLLAVVKTLSVCAKLYIVESLYLHYDLHVPLHDDLILELEYDHSAIFYYDFVSPSSHVVGYSYDNMLYLMRCIYSDISAKK